MRLFKIFSVLVLFSFSGQSCVSSNKKYFDINDESMHLYIIISLKFLLTWGVFCLLLVWIDSFRDCLEGEDEQNSTFSTTPDLRHSNI